MLVEMAIADAFAIPWEFVPRTQYHLVGDPNEPRFRQHPKYADLGNGRYTDDTQRALANAECIIGEEGQMQHDFIRAYLNAYHRDPRAGYSKRFAAFLQANTTTDEWLANMEPYGNTNGSLMGVAPLGYLKSPWQIKEAVYAQAMCTHSPETFLYAEAVALAAHHFLIKGGRTDIAAFLTKHMPRGFIDDWIAAQSLPDDMTARSTFLHVMRALETQNSLMAIIQYAIEHTDDSDSVAAVGVALASCCAEYENDIPQTLYDGLEDGPYGYKYLADVDRQLKEIFAPDEPQTKI